MKLSALLLLSVSLVGRSVADEQGAVQDRPPTLRQLERVASQALRDESMSDGPHARATAVRRLVELDRSLRNDRRLATSPTLKRLRAKIRSRLRAVQRRLADQRQRETRRIDHALTSDGAPGGRAQRGDHADELIELIQATIKPDTWNVNGGPSAIYYFAPRHALVVTAPSEVHSSVRQNLIDLRRAGN